MRWVSVTILKAKEMGKGKEMNKTIEFKLLHVLYTEAYWIAMRHKSTHLSRQTLKLTGGLKSFHVSGGLKEVAA